jgi:hypothetical protein
MRRTNAAARHQEIADLIAAGKSQTGTNGI